MDKITGARAIVATLQECDTELVVGFIGHSTHEVARELEGSGIRVVNPATELGGAYMTLAFNYLRGRSASVGVWHTVGSLLLPPALREATSSRIPSLHIGLNADSRLRHREGLQQVPAEVFEKVTRLTARVERVDTIPDALLKAYQAAHGIPAGATYVDVPFDLTADRAMVQVPKRPPAPVRRSRPYAEDTQRLLDLLCRAERPVLVVGGGAVSSGAGAEIARLAELLSVPVVTTTTAQGIVPEDHPLVLGTSGQAGWTCANDTLAEADLALVLGSRLSDWGISQGFTSRMPTLVQVDLDPARLGEMYHPEFSLVADVRGVVAAVVELAESPEHAARVAAARADRSELLALAAERKRAWRAFVDEAGRDDRFPVSPWRMMAQVRALLGEDDILVSDIGNHTSWSLQGTVLRKPRRMLLSFGEAVLGSAIPLGIGAQLAEPDATVVVATGDGAAQYHLNELRVAVEHDLPVIFLVLDNGGYDANHKMMTGKFGSSAWSRFTNPDYAQIARAYGAQGERIESADQLTAALNRARAARAPYVIHLPIDPEVTLVDNHVSGPAFLLEGRDIPADESGTLPVGVAR